MTTPQEDRIIRAKTAVEAYAGSVRGDFMSHDEVISDLLADLMHLVDHLDLVETEGQDFDDLIARAEMNYTEEKAENNA